MKLDLSPDAQEALIDLQKWVGGDYTAVIEQAVLDRRAKVADPGPPVVVTLHPGDTLEAVAWADPVEGPWLWLGDERVRVKLLCAGDYPTAAEVAAVERLAAEVVAAANLFRRAHAQRERR